MDRRQFIAASVVSATAAGAATAAEVAASGNDRQKDEAELKARLADWYRAFGDPRIDMARYLDFTTSDYLLIEKGELLDRAADAALMNKNPPDMVRTDRFDFRRIHVDGDRADLVYFLDSTIKDSKGSKDYRWIESAIAVREGGVWRFSLLHSSRVPDAPAAGQKTSGA